MMASDEKIRQEVWNGVIPVALSLAQNEVATLQQPEPYYVCLKDFTHSFAHLLFEHGVLTFFTLFFNTAAGSSLQLFHIMFSICSRTLFACHSRTCR